MKHLTFSEIANLNIGQVFYEEEHGDLERFVVSSVPVIVKSRHSDGAWAQLEWWGEKRDGKRVHFLMTKELMHYGPSICKGGGNRRKKCEHKAE